jgi:hypothetical protein
MSAMGGKWTSAGIKPPGHHLIPEVRIVAVAVNDISRALLVRKLMPRPFRATQPSAC